MLGPYLDHLASEVLFLFLFCSSAKFSVTEIISRTWQLASQGTVGVEARATGGHLWGNPDSVKLSTAMLRDEVSVVLIGG